MTDLYLEKDDNNNYDIAIASNGDFQLTSGLDTAFKLSILEENRDDSVDEPSKRRGWWGNQLRNDNYELGSLLWRQYQTRLTDESDADIQEAIDNCLQWLIDDGIASSVETELVLDTNTVTATITVTKNETIIDSFYIELFSNTLA